MPHYSVKWWETGSSEHDPFSSPYRRNFSQTWATSALVLSLLAKTLYQQSGKFGVLEWCSLLIWSFASFSQPCYCQQRTVKLCHRLRRTTDPTRWSTRQRKRLKQQRVTWMMDNRFQDCKKRMTRFFLQLRTSWWEVLNTLPSRHQHGPFQTCLQYPKSNLSWQTSPRNLAAV